MKKTLYLIMLIIPALAAFTSCESTESEPVSTPIEVPVAFDFNVQALFPGAANVQWEKQYGYMVADFTYHMHRTEAWFNSEATWVMTVTHYGNDTREIPEAVTESITAADAGTLVDIMNYKLEEITYWIAHVKKEGVETAIVMFDNGRVRKICELSQLGVVLPNTVF